MGFAAWTRFVDSYDVKGAALVRNALIRVIRFRLFDSGFWVLGYWPTSIWALAA